MNPWVYIRYGLAWSFHAVRSWVQIGSRLSSIERQLAEQQSESRLQLQSLEDSMTGAARSMAEGFIEINRLITGLNKEISIALADQDRAMNTRLDHWAQTFSGQLNQAYATAFRVPAESRDR